MTDFELTDFLRQTYTPEYIDALHVLRTALERLGVQAHEDAIAVMLPTAHNYEPMDFGAAVVDAIRDAAFTALSTMGIIATEDISNSLLGILVTFVADFQSTDDDETIKGYLENETDPKEALVQILELVTTVPVDDWVINIEELTQEQFDNMYTLVSGWITAKEDIEEVDGEDPTEVPLEASVEALVTSYLPRDSSGMVEAMRSAMVPVGTGIESLLNLYDKHVESLESLDDQVRALVAMHLYSGESRESLFVETMESVRGFVLEDNLRTEMRVKRIVDESIKGLDW